MWYTNAIIIDTEKGVLVQNGDRLCVLVENGIITSISSQPDSSKDIEVVDLGGLFLCPGLIDTHVHVCAVPGGLVSINYISTKGIQALRRAPIEPQGDG